MEKKYLTLKEKICFPLSAFGRSGIYTIMTMFYLVFLVDVAKLNAVTASAIILGGRIFDALNDPIMGMIVDKTRSKWGKMRPYLLFSPIPVCVSTILCLLLLFKAARRLLHMLRVHMCFGVFALRYKTFLFGD